MYVNHLRILCILLGSFIFATHCRASSYENFCYREISGFMISNFGENYEKDGNLEIEAVGERLVIVTDKTPVTNPPRYVFLKTQNKKDLCLVLSAPVANEVEFSRLQRNGIPKNIITRSGGNAPSDLRIRYEWNPDKRKYEAIECTQSGIVRKKRIVCESVLEAFK